MPTVAHLVTQDDRVVGGVAQRSDDYALIVRGEVMAATDSAGMAIAMLRHARNTLSREHAPLAIRIAPALTNAAAVEAANAGLELDTYLVALEGERLERAARRGPTRQ